MSAFRLLASLESFPQCIPQQYIYAGTYRGATYSLIMKTELKNNSIKKLFCFYFERPPNYASYSWNLPKQLMQPYCNALNPLSGSNDYRPMVLFYTEYNQYTHAVSKWERTSALPFPRERAVVLQFAARKCIHTNTTEPRRHRPKVVR